MKFLYFFCFCSIFCSLLISSCGKEETTESAPATVGPPRVAKTGPWQGVEFLELPREGEPIEDVNTRTLQFSDNFSIEAKFDEDTGHMTTVCRIQSKEQMTYRFCFEYSDDDNAWMPFCKQSNNQEWTTQQDINCSVFTQAFQYQSSDAQNFCTAQEDNDETHISVKCQDNRGLLVFHRSDEGHASKRVCRTHQGEQISGRCLDITEEIIEGEIIAATVTAAKLQATTWAGYEAWEEEDPTGGTEAKTKKSYVPGEIPIDSAATMSIQTVENTPDNADVSFEITQGEGSVCSWVDQDTGELRGDNPGECKVALMVKAQGFVDRKISHTLSVRNIYTLIWPGYPNPWLKTTETLSPMPITGAGGSSEKVFSVANSPDCEINTTDGMITAEETLTENEQLPSGQSSCVVQLTVTDTGLMTTIFTTSIGLYNQEAQNANPLTTQEPYGENPELVLHSSVLFKTGDIQGKGAINYQSVNTNTCTVDPNDGTVAATGIGTCEIQAQALGLPGETPPGPWENILTVVVGKARSPASFSWPADPYGSSPELVFGGYPLAFVNTPTPHARSVGAIEYQSRDTAICTVGPSSGTITPKTQGQCIIEARYSGNTSTHPSAWAAYSPIAVGNTIMLTDFSYSASSVIFDATPPTLVAPTRNPPNANVAYALAGDSAGCTVAPDGGLTLTDVGNCKVVATATLSGYDSSSAETTITITPATQAAVSGYTYSSLNPPFTGSAPTLDPPDTPLQATFTYSTTAAATICTVENDGTVALKGVGSCPVTVEATRTGYNSVSQTVTIQVGKGEQTLSWPSNPYGNSPALSYGGTLAIVNVPTAGQGSILYEAAPDTTNCSVNNIGTITGNRVGVCIIRARYSGNATYEASDWAVGLNINITPASQTFSWPSNPYGANPSLVVGADIVLSNSPSSGSGTIQYRATNDRCTVNGAGVVRGMHVGDCTVEGRYGGVTGTHSPSAWVAISTAITVSKGMQSAPTWPNNNPYGATPNIHAHGTPLNLVITANAGHGPLEYRRTSSSASYCNVNSANGRITPLDAGDCRVQLRHYGNADYQASDWSAETVVTISKATQTAFVWPASPYGATPVLTAGGSNLALDTNVAMPTASVTDGAEGAIEYRAKDSTKCTVASSTGIISPPATASGGCTVQARYGSTSNYNESQWVDGPTITVQ